MSRVSVVIPTFNRAGAIRDAIESVLDQTLSGVEIIVIDDGSTDDTKAVVSSYAGVTYERVEHHGACAARNRGIELATGEYLLFLDSDDVLYKTALEDLAGALDRNPDSGAAYCGYVITSHPGEVHSKSALDRSSGDVFVPMCTEHICILHCVLARRDLISKIGGFDARLSQFEDWDLWIRAAAEAPFTFVPKHLVEYRRWTDGASALAPGFYQAGELLLRKYRAYLECGRLTREQWKLVRSRFRGQFRNTWTALAFISYKRGDYRRCVACALRGFLAWPASLLNRGVWSITVKSLLKGLAAPKRPRAA